MMNFWTLESLPVYKYANKSTVCQRSVTITSRGQRRARELRAYCQLICLSKGP